MLSDLFDKFSSKLLVQLLKEEKVSLSWVEHIQKLSKTVAASVGSSCLPESDSNDIRNYVKIKRITGGSKSDYRIVNGHAFTKNVAHRKMRRSIDNPKVLLLSFPIIYDPPGKKIINLESMTLQELAFLKSLVARIAFHKPDIVVVDNLVARLAQEMILDLGITLVYSVKTQVLEKLSHFCSAKIIPSYHSTIRYIDLGVCKKFYTRTFNGSKTLMFFESFCPSLGCSIVLRGSSQMLELEKIKDISYFMIFCYYNWKMESALLSDLYAHPSNEVPDDICLMDSENQQLDDFSIAYPCDDLFQNEVKVEPVEINDGSDPLQAMAAAKYVSSVASSPPSPVSSKESTVDINLEMRIAEYLRNAVLSCSPLLNVDMPYFLSEDCDEFFLKRFLNFDDIYWSAKLKAIGKKEEDIEVEEPLSPRGEKNVTYLPPHPFATRDLKQKLNSIETKNLLSDFRARGSKISKSKNVCLKKPLEPSLSEDEVLIDALDPRFHQRLPVLYCSFSLSESTTFCVDPHICMIEYYGSYDMPLGAFLNRYCFSPSFACGVVNCKTSVVDHIRKFIHGTGSVQISLKKLKNPIKKAQSDIITWSWCEECKTVGPISTLSEDATLLSFGKFLELKLYGENYKRLGKGQRRPCFEHSIFTNHRQFFSYKNILACFMHERITIHAIAPPPPRIKVFLGEGFNESGSFKDGLTSATDGMKMSKEQVFITLSEDNPGSIIAYAMSMPEYERQLVEIIRGTSSPIMRKKFLTSNDSNSSIFSTIIHQTFDSPVDLSSSSLVASFNSNLNPSSSHIELQFTSGNTKYLCCVYFPEKFRKMRSELIEINSDQAQVSNFSTPTSTPSSTCLTSNFSVEEVFKKSISSSVPWTAVGGKSGATFCKTSDDRFILKEMSRSELHSFLKISKFYFDHISSSLNQQRPSLLAKIFGIYKIRCKNGSINPASKMYLLIMENLFYQRTIKLKFDLKGSSRNRLANYDCVPDDIVLLDENLIRLVRESPLYIRNLSKRVLSSAIDYDSYFLASHSVMDYSLLVGIDDNKREYVVGIIDYIRAYTWDKKIENVGKSVGGHGKMPTVVSPNIYRERFCDKMNQYFLCVPDRWYGIETIDKPFK